MSAFVKLHEVVANKFLLIVNSTNSTSRPRLFVDQSIQKHMPFASVYAEAVDLIDGSTKQPWRKHKPEGWSFEMMCFYTRWDGGLGGLMQQSTSSTSIQFDSIGNRGDGRRRERNNHRG